MRTIREYRIFIASPSGQDDVRQAFREELAEYNQMDALRRGLLFTPVGWEETLAGPQRPQSLINTDLKTCDAFVLVLQDRWGSPPADEKGPYSSGSEEEFELAKLCLMDPAYPMTDLMVLFRGADPRQLADPGPQLAKVLAFRQGLEQSKAHLFGVFDAVDEFRRLLCRHLAAWVHAAEQNHPLGHVKAEPLVLASKGHPETLSSRADLDAAQELAEQGRLTEAETLFARLIVGGSDPDACNRYGNFLWRLGRWSQATVMYERVLELAKSHGEIWEAKAYNNLALLHAGRGELGRAEELFRQALEINERLGRHEGMATAYRNRGYLAQAHGNLEEAESLYYMALEIEEQLGRHEGMATIFSNLGTLAQARGNLEEAESLLGQALVIEEQLSRRDGISRVYNNQGTLAQKRGELAEAESLYCKALAIEEQLGRREGMASIYGNFGTLARARNNLEEAEAMFRKALEIYEQLGSRIGMANAYEDLSAVYEQKSDLTSARDVCQRSLSLYAELGNRGKVERLTQRLTDLTSEN